MEQLDRLVARDAKGEPVTEPLQHLRNDVRGVIREVRDTLYDLRTDPDELMNVYGHPEMRSIRDRMMQRLYGALRERGDNFYHWMTTMYDVGEVDYDPTQSGLDETTYDTSVAESV